MKFVKNVKAIREINKENYKENRGHYVLLNIIHKAFGQLGKDKPSLLNYKGFGIHLKLDTIINKLHLGTRYFVYYFEGEAIACFGLEEDKQNYKLLSLAVLPEYWHRGLGAWLMSVAEDYVIDLGGQKIKLGMLEENELLYNWYQSKGYKKVAAKRGVIFMEKEMQYWYNITRFKGYINKSEESCSHCGMWQPRCICKSLRRGVSPYRIILLTHENELMRLTNTGRIIKETFPKETVVLKWQRSEISQHLKKMLADDNNYLVFPEQFAKHKAVDIPSADKRASFVIIDGTWDEAKKIYNKSDYLQALPVVSFREVRQSIYNLRRNQEQGSLCTAEIAMELFHHMEAYEEEQLLVQNFELFINNFDKSRKML